MAFMRFACVFAAVMLVLMTLVTLLAEILTQYSRRERRRRFARREKLSMAEWCHLYRETINVPCEMAWGVAVCFATAMRCDPSQIRPSDSFDVDFRVRVYSLFGDAVDDDLQTVEDFLLPRLIGGVLMRDFQTQAFATVADLLRWIAASTTCDIPHKASGSQEVSAGDSDD